nr:nucleotidyl transferase AbiEii/AbiGii toxin family protein [Sphingomonas sp. Y57]
MAKPVQNLGASVRARLLNHSRAHDQSFELILIRFALERLLYRLSQSAHADRFILKGAMLLSIWFDDPTRPTRDLDLLGFGEADSEAILATFRDILSVEVDDGITFDLASVRIDRIREQLEYGGVRLQADAHVGGARVRASVDIGFGDALEPGVEELDYPVLLDFPVPKLRAYAQETVIAEKFQAMVLLGRANSRMKDFYDIWLLSRSFTFDPDRVARAIAATFGRRRTPIPLELPDALTDGFAGDAAKLAQWTAFARGLDAAPADLGQVIADIRDFLMENARRAAALG